MGKILKTNPPGLAPDKGMNDNLPEYPVYPESEDIYNKFKKEKNMDPEDISKVKKSDKNDKARVDIEKKVTDDISGRDLDIPGSELDDEQENVGNEDEENNYYSIGGDDHTIWMRIRMIYREVELITKYLYLCPRLNTKTVS